MQIHDPSVGFEGKQNTAFITSFYWMHLEKGGFEKSKQLEKNVL